MFVKTFKNKFRSGKLLMDKKGSLGLIAAIIVLALVILAYILVAVAERECFSNRDCSDNAYCSTDYKCHQYPDKILVNDNNYFSSALVFGILLVVAAYVYKTGKIPFANKFKKIKRKKRKVETEDGYIEI